MEKNIKKYVGSVCEIKTMDNNLIFNGKITAISDGLMGTIEIATKGYEVVKIYDKGYPVKIHIFNTRLGAYILGGRIDTANSDKWIVYDLCEYSEIERRGFFRIGVDSKAVVTKATETDYNLEEEQALDDRNADLEITSDGENASLNENEVVLVNISLSGILLFSSAEFEINDKLLISELFIANDPKPFIFLCEVKRIVDDVYGRRYGCNFSDMNEAMSDRLCRDIFDLQRKEIQYRRNRDRI